ncbi:MAG: 4-hydroxy-3-methylbut-2-enyl diphosphate reductase [Gammaproteobacteria bacterium]|nr:4-hydroxy-3-methylbut-2-enyl diphosphate reductase [Gammaproteobacteria bacterium]
MKVLLANPRGFCAGVDRAIEIVERALEMLKGPIYVRHEVVHNRCVVEELGNKGAIFVEELDEIPEDSVVIFSAHGVSRNVREEACRRRLRVIDATCPLVTKVHIEVLKNHQEGYETILIGHRGHPEVDGTMGQYDTAADQAILLVESPQDAEQIQVRNPHKVAMVTQTTLSLDDTAEIIEILVKRFPDIRRPRKDDICYATQNRQNTIKELVKICDLILIVGSKNSSNSNRLHEIAVKRSIESYLIDTPEEISSDWLLGKQCIGLSAGASAPEALVKRVVRTLRDYGATEVVEQAGVEEKITFRLPKELWDFSANAMQR